MSTAESDQASTAESARRMAVASRIAACSSSAAAQDGPAVVMAAGSVGAGRADRLSDLEIDCYWADPPTAEARRRPTVALGAEMRAFWDYDEDDREWSEDYTVGSLEVTVSNFLVATVEEFIARAMDRADTDPTVHMRLAAVRSGRTLRGAAQVAAWRDRIEYPPALRDAVLASVLDSGFLRGWSARETYAPRRDVIAGTDLLVRLTDAIVRCVLALNGVFVPHRSLKWQRDLLAGLEDAPADLSARLDRAFREAPGGDWSGVESLLADTVGLIRARTDVIVPDEVADWDARRVPFEP